jgi:hypothetical protein
MNISKKYFVLSSVAFLLIAIPALAQDANNGVKFDAPFAFQVRDVTMPAGSYKVTQPDINVAVLLVQDAGGSHSALVAYTPVDDLTPQPDTLIGFKQYGDVEFMNRITVADEDIEIQLSQSKAEEKAAGTAVAAEHTVPATSIAALPADSTDTQPINGTN